MPIHPLAAGAHVGPGLCESLLLLAACAWLLYLSFRQQPHPRALIFAAVYLFAPAVMMGARALGWHTILAGPGRWFTVAANATLLCTMIAHTYARSSPVVRALVEVEKETQRRERQAQANVLARVVMLEQERHGV